MSSSATIPEPAAPRPIRHVLTWGEILLREWRYEWSRLRPTVLYAVRVALSVGLALWLAGFLMLEQPISAVTTVLIVANPTPGALMSKSIWRIIGTLIGTTFGITLMAVFPQQPVLFFAGLASLVGAACCVATLLRFYRAYAAVLSGYTIIIIAVSAFDDPDLIFLSAMSRLSVVVVGIISTAVVFQITSMKSPNTAATRIELLLRDVLSQFASLSPTERDAGAPRSDEAGQEGAFREMDATAYGARARLLAQAAAVTEAIEYASSVDYEVSRRSAALHQGVSRLLGLLSTHHAAWQQLPSGDASRVIRARSISGTLMRELADMPAETLLHADPAPIRARISTAILKIEKLAQETPDLSGLAAIDTERDIVVQLGLAVDNLSDVAWRERGVRLMPLFEWPAALRNGARGMLVTLIGCLMWYVLHWSSAPNMLVYLIAASCLLATAPSATRGAVLLASGTALAVPACYVFQTFLLPRTDGFPLLWASLVLCLLPGIWIQFHPKYALRGFGYAVFFNVMARVQNPVRYDDIALFNGWFAFLIAAALLALVFRVILPADQRLDVSRLVTALCRSVQKFAALPLRKEVSWPGWEYLQMQRVLRLSQRLAFVDTSERVFHVTDAALAAVALGRVVMRLRTLLRDGDATPQQEKAVMHALESLRDLRRDPLATAERLRASAVAIRPGLAQSPSSAPVRREEGQHLVRPAAVSGAWMGEDGDISGTEDMRPDENVAVMGTARRMAACLVQAAQLIDAVPGFFHKEGPMQQGADHPRAHTDLRLLTMPRPRRPDPRAASC
ncbi:FUSC family protein [Acetobacter fallax]|uniref:FUSC family protein n=1 Tax=Acetobacter fallax TaxID=1737473 RepID=A0ABX0K826_9PROT|nr:FUSC family protein [Acetobacter fallax]NHO32572.1 FUSC family protein [Acetobacter fallax]NHO36083.1 FUSC family protein [Acetobacter fallax]